jgi:hypothetical protein
LEQLSLKRKPLVYLLILVLFLAGTVLFSYSFLLPRYIEKKVLPALGRQLANALTAKVYSIGLSAADLGDIILGDPQNPAVTIGSVHAGFSLHSLLAKKLGQVRINGLVLHLEVSEGRLIMPGFDPGKFASSQPDTDQKYSAVINLPFAPEKLQVRNGLVTISYAGKRFWVPFDLQLNRGEGGNRLSLYNLSLQTMPPQGEKITLTGIILHGEERFRPKFGKASIKGEAEIGLLPFQLVSANLAVAPELTHPGKIPVVPGKITPDAGPAIYLEVKNDREQLLVKAQAFMREPFSASFELLGSIDRGHDNVQSSGTFVFRNTELSGAENHGRAFMLHKNNPELHGDFVFTLDRYGTWKAALKSPGQKQQGDQSRVLQFKYDKFSLQSEMPFLDLQGHGNAAAHEIQLSLAMARVQASYDGAEISMPEANLRASYFQEEDQGRGRTSRSTVSLKLDSTKFQKKTLSAKADIFMQGEMLPQLTDGKNPLQAEGSISVANH